MDREASWATVHGDTKELDIKNLAIKQWLFVAECMGRGKEGKR